MDDTVPESIEWFNVILWKTIELDNRITLDPVNREIQIVDGDGIYQEYCIEIKHYKPSLGAVVGLERTFFSVSEGDPSVTVCAVIVYVPDTTVSCPISFPFSVALSTGDMTASTIRFRPNMSYYIFFYQKHPWTAGGSLAEFHCMSEEQLCWHTLHHYRGCQVFRNLGKHWSFMPSSVSLYSCNQYLWWQCRYIPILIW